MSKLLPLAYCTGCHTTFTTRQFKCTSCGQLCSMMNSQYNFQLVRKSKSKGVRKGMMK